MKGGADEGMVKGWSGEGMEREEGMKRRRDGEREKKRWKDADRKSVV